MRLPIPRFLREGYALHEEGKPVLAPGVTGIKPDAPSWAHEEYREYVHFAEIAAKKTLGEDFYRE